MKIVHVLQDIDFTIKSSVTKRLEQNKKYIVSNALFSRLRSSVSSAIGIEFPFNEVYKKYPGTDLSGKKILMIRHGGGGDILFISTGVKELKRRFPSAEINLAISEQYMALVESEQEISRIYTLPIELDKWNSFDYHLVFEGLLEESELAYQYNAYDLFMLKMGLDVFEVDPQNKIPTITIHPSEKDEIKSKLPMLTNSSKKVGIQIESSAPIRNYSIYNFYKIAKSLIEKGYDVYFFGSAIQNNLVFSLVKELGNKSFNAVSSNLRNSLILASFMDFFIAPDSMFIHVAGALKIPLIGLYGPFPSESRMKYFKNSIGLGVEEGCAPCFQHTNETCFKGNPSPCMMALSPEIVLEAFSVLEKEVLGK